MPERMRKPRIMKKSSKYSRRRVDSRVMIRAVKVKQVMLNIVMIAFYKNQTFFSPPPKKRKGKQILAKANPDNRGGGEGEGGNHGP